MSSITLAVRNQRSVQDIHRVRATVRRANAAVLRAQGLELKEIGRQLGISTPYVCKILKAAMQEVCQLSEVERHRYEVMKRPAGPESPQENAVALRMAGFTYAAIAKELHEDDETVRRWVNKEMSRLHALEVSALDTVRRLQLERIDAMLFGIWRSATSGDPKSIDAVLRLLERQAKLLGLDAPERVDVEHHMMQVARDAGLTEEDADAAIKEVQLMLAKNGRHVN